MTVDDDIDVTEGFDLEKDESWRWLVVSLLALVAVLVGYWRLFG